MRARHRFKSHPHLQQDRGLTQFRPVLDPCLGHQAVPRQPERNGAPASLRKAGRRELVGVARPRATRMAKRRVDDLLKALDKQTVVVPGTGTTNIVIPSLSRLLGAVHRQPRATEAQISALPEAHTLSQVLTSVQGIAVRTPTMLRLHPLPHRRPLAS